MKGKRQNGAGVRKSAKARQGNSREAENGANGSSNQGAVPSGGAIRLDAADREEDGQ